MAYLDRERRSARGEAARATFNELLDRHAQGVSSSEGGKTRTNILDLLRSFNHPFRGQPQFPRYMALSGAGTFLTTRVVTHAVVILLAAAVGFGEYFQSWSLQAVSARQERALMASGGGAPREPADATVAMVVLYEPLSVAEQPGAEPAVVAPEVHMPLPEHDAVFNVVHQLAEGETLGEVANRYGITLATLIWSNGLESGDVVAVGRELRIPRVSGLPYTIQEGDTLVGIAARFDVAPEAILQFKPNMLRSEAPLPVGQEIFVPGGTHPLPEALLALHGGVEGLAASAAQPAAVVRDMKTNLREGPGVEYARVGQFQAGRYARLLGRHGEWLKVDIAGTSGWMHTGLLDIPAGLSETLPEINDFPPLPPKWVWPTHGSITSYFGPRWGSFHNGVDIANRAWTPIVAARSGIVSEAGWCSGYGYCVKIRHDGGIQTIYGHLIDQPVVAVREEVVAGQLIGYMGSTYDARGGGYSTGVHLHFTITVNGSAVDPLKFLP